MSESAQEALIEDLSRLFLGNAQIIPNAKKVDGRVCKEHSDLLIFYKDWKFFVSAKASLAQLDSEDPVAWGRWHKKRVKEGVKTVKGAYRYLTDPAARLYFDNDCGKPIPFNISKPDKDNSVLIVITGGTESLSATKKGLHGCCEIANYADSPLVPMRLASETGEIPVHVIDETGFKFVIGLCNTPEELLMYFGVRNEFVTFNKQIVMSGENELVSRFLLDRQCGAGFTDPVHISSSMQNGVVGGTYDKIRIEPWFEEHLAHSLDSLPWDRYVERLRVQAVPICGVTNLALSQTELKQLHDLVSEFLRHERADLGKALTRFHLMTDEELRSNTLNVMIRTKKYSRAMSVTSVLRDPDVNAELTSARARYLATQGLERLSAKFPDEKRLFSFVEVRDAETGGWGETVIQHPIGEELRTLPYFQAKG